MTQNKKLTKTQKGSEIKAWKDDGVVWGQMTSDDEGVEGTDRSKASGGCDQNSRRVITLIPEQTQHSKHRNKSEPQLNRREMRRGISSERSEKRGCSFIQYSAPRTFQIPNSKIPWSSIIILIPTTFCNYITCLFGYPYLFLSLRLPLLSPFQRSEKQNLK